MDAPCSEQDSSRPACSLCEELERLVHIERRAAWLVCHHFAELADRFESEDPDLDAYEDIYQLGLLRLGMGERAVRERIRVGRALRLLPQTRSAFAHGEISYAKVREVTRIADPESEEQWLRTARGESVRSLERRVARARHTEPAAVPRQREERPSSDGELVDVQLRLPTATWSLVLQAMDATRRTSQVSLSDAEALEAVARWALASRPAQLASARQCAPSGAALVQEPSSPPEQKVAGEATTETAAHVEKDDVRFLDEVASRTANLELLDSAASRIGRETSAPDGDRTRDITRPGHEPSPAGSTPAETDGRTRPGHEPNGTDSPVLETTDSGTPGHEYALVPAPGRPAVSADCVDDARKLVPAIESGRAENPDQLLRMTGLSLPRFSLTVLELVVAGIVAQTHRGLVLTPWALRNRFKAVGSKLRH